MQQRGRDVAAHPLAQRQLPDRYVEQVAEVEQFHEGRQVLPVPRHRDAVHLLQDGERVLQRQVPPQRGALAEHHADPLGQLEPMPRRIDAGHPDRAADGTRIPVSILIVVDFPAPFGPM